MIEFLPESGLIQEKSENGCLMQHIECGILKILPSGHGSATWC